MCFGVKEVDQKAPVLAGCGCPEGRDIPTRDECHDKIHDSTDRNLATIDWGGAVSSGESLYSLALDHGTNPYH